MRLFRLPLGAKITERETTTLLELRRDTRELLALLKRITLFRGREDRLSDNRSRVATSQSQFRILESYSRVTDRLAFAIKAKPAQRSNRDVRSQSIRTTMNPVAVAHRRDDSTALIE